MIIRKIDIDKQLSGREEGTQEKEIIKLRSRSLIDDSQLRDLSFLQELSTSQTSPISRDHKAKEILAKIVDLY